ncbi:MAG: cell division protein ZapE [Granulosicoccaceae bacterium]
MGPLARYQQQLDAGELTPDSAQLQAVTLLDTLALELQKPTPQSSSLAGLFSRFLRSNNTAAAGPDGLYLWGGVGRGKTHLCDMFYDSVTIEDKTRLHFHRFMQRIHNDLNALGNTENPLPMVAEQWAARAKLLVLDEIHVNDITDAMLLGGLLTELFKRGVTLVTTSNVPPDGLYKDGLQRARFLPAIEHIKTHTQVHELGGDTDYRLRLLQTEAIYIVSEFDNTQSGAASKQAMQDHFGRLKTSSEQARGSMVINDRELPFIKRAGDLAWFSFEALCDSPRSTADYIELATTFQTIMLSDVPVLDSMRDDAARRLINLVDEFYDRHVKLIASAEAQPEGLYRGKRLEFEFVRAASRLREMQTVEYLKVQREVDSN